MKYRFSLVLIIVTLSAIAIGFGYQVHMLRQEVAEIRKQLKELGVVRLQPLSVPVSHPASPNASGPFRLLNTETLVDPGVERGMKADEFQRQQELRRQLESEMIPAPEQPELNLRSHAN